MLLIVIMLATEGKMGMHRTVHKASSRKAVHKSGQGREARLATRAMVRAEIAANPLGHAGVPYWYTQCNTTLSRCREPKARPQFVVISKSNKTCKVDTSAVGFVTEWCTKPKAKPKPKAEGIEPEWYYPLVVYYFYKKCLRPWIDVPGLKG